MKAFWVKAIVLSVLIVAGVAVFFGVSLYHDNQTRKAPKNPLAICRIFKAHPDWYHASYHVEKRYGVPISLQMAVIYQESRFRSAAEPKREYIFGWLPWLRQSTAEGYSQALDDTWHYYLKETGQLSANRDYFSDSVAFVGWYLHCIHRYLHIPMTHTYSLYLAYHEGMRGYLSRHYLSDRGLRRSAFDVERVARHYRARLIQCEKEFVRYR